MQPVVRETKASTVETTRTRPALGTGSLPKSPGRTGKTLPSAEWAEVGEYGAPSWLPVTRSAIWSLSWASQAWLGPLYSLRLRHAPADNGDPGSHLAAVHSRPICNTVCNSMLSVLTSSLGSWLQNHVFMSQGKALCPTSGSDLRSNEVIETLSARRGSTE